jgi:6-phosphogluconate dehydrogenase
MADETRFGMTGLGVMGANLARNVAHHGIPIAVYDGDEGPITGTGSVAELVAALQRPRTIMVMENAGPPVDAVIR